MCGKEIRSQAGEMPMACAGGSAAEERINLAAVAILEKYRAAFEELAK